MDCRELERRLEALVDGALSEHERRRCEAHLERCPRCRRLVAPLAAPPAAAGAVPAELVAAVLARTSGPVCGRAEGLLGDWLDGELAPPERALVDDHLASCDGCRGLAAALTRLSAELPGLAELEPGPGFVDGVLAATLPPAVRLRRWFERQWPRWVRRPRFASEAAFVATLILVLVVATPGSPLEAVPSRALELARSDAVSRIGAPVERLEAGFTARVEAPVRARWQRAGETVEAWADRAGAGGRTLAEKLRQGAGTAWRAIASLWERADHEAAKEPTGSKD